MVQLQDKQPAFSLANPDTFHLSKGHDFESTPAGEVTIKPLKGGLEIVQALNKLGIQTKSEFMY